MSKNKQEWTSEAPPVLDFSKFSYIKVIFKKPQIQFKVTH